MCYIVLFIVNLAILISCSVAFCFCLFSFRSVLFFCRICRWEMGVLEKQTDNIDCELQTLRYFGIQKKICIIGKMRCKHWMKKLTWHIQYSVPYINRYFQTASSPTMSNYRNTSVSKLGTETKKLKHLEKWLKCFAYRKSCFMIWEEIKNISSSALQGNNTRSAVRAKTLTAYSIRRFSHEQLCKIATAPVNERKEWMIWKSTKILFKLNERNRQTQNLWTNRLQIIMVITKDWKQNRNNSNNKMHWNLLTWLRKIHFHLLLLYRWGVLKQCAK